MKRHTRWGLIVLALMVLVISTIVLVYLNAAAIAIYLVSAPLKEQGYRLEQLEIATLRPQQTIVTEATLHALDTGDRLHAENITLDYTFDTLLAGRVDAIRVETMAVGLGMSETIAITEQFKKAQALLQKDWRQQIPFNQVRIDRLHFEQGDVSVDLNEITLQSGVDDVVLDAGSSQYGTWRLQHSAAGQWRLLSRDTGGVELKLEALDDSQGFRAGLSADSERLLSLLQLLNVDELLAPDGHVSMTAVLSMDEGKLDLAVELSIPRLAYGSDHVEGLALQANGLLDFLSGEFPHNLEYTGDMTLAAERASLQGARFEKADIRFEGDFRLAETTAFEGNASVSIGSLQGSFEATHFYVESLRAFHQGPISYSEGKLEGKSSKIELAASILRPGDQYSLKQPGLKLQAGWLHEEAQTRLKIAPGFEYAMSGVESGEAALNSITLTNTSQLMIEREQGLWHIGQLEGNLQIEPFKLAGNALHPSLVTFAIERFDAPLQQPVMANLSLASLQATVAEREFEFSDLKQQITAGSRELQVAGSLYAESPGLPLGYQLVHDLQSGAGSLNLERATLEARTLKTTLMPLIPRWPTEVDLVTGKISIEGGLQWSDEAGLQPAEATVRMAGIGGRYVTSYFSGLDGEFLVTLSEAIEATSQRVRVSTIDIGVPVTDISSRMSLRIDENRLPVIRLQTIRARMLGGRLDQPQVTLDLNRKVNHFSLGFQGIDVAELVALHQVDGLKADGKLSGTLPMELGPAGVRVRQGKVRADAPGGQVNYVPTGGGEALGKSSMQAGILLDVLKDFQYHELDATADYSPDGALTLQVAFKGKNVELYGERPIHFNLNLEQNILSLVKSLRAVNGINERIDQSVQRYYRNRKK